MPFWQYWVTLITPGALATKVDRSEVGIGRKDGSGVAIDWVTWSCSHEGDGSNVQSGLRDRVSQKVLAGSGWARHRGLRQLHQGGKEVPNTMSAQNNATI